MDGEVAVTWISEQLDSIIEGAPAVEGVVQSLVEYAQVLSISVEHIMFLNREMSEDDAVGEHCYEQENPIRLRLQVE